MDGRRPTLSLEEAQPKDNPYTQTMVATYGLSLGLRVVDGTVDAVWNSPPDEMSH